MFYGKPEFLLFFLHEKKKKTKQSKDSVFSKKTYLGYDSREQSFGVFQENSDRKPQGNNLFEKCEYEKRKEQEPITDQSNIRWLAHFFYYYYYFNIF